MSEGVDPRRVLLDLFATALRAVHGRACVRAALMDDSATAPVRVIAVGKAAADMTLGAYDALGKRLDHALVVSRAGHFGGLEGIAAPISVIEGAHPWPDERSVRAAGILIRAIETTPVGTRLLFLFSGGLSSLIEWPPEGVSIDAIARLHAWLLASGLPIATINAIRRRCSRIKDGRLGAFLEGRAAEVLLISDVPDDDPALIGSGPLCPSHAALPEGEFPDWIHALLACSPPALRDIPPVPHRVVATLDQALDAVSMRAQSLGLPVRRDAARFAGEAGALGVRFATELLEGAPGIMLRGGESTVTLPAHPGHGGRNQQLALTAARVLADHAGVALLCAGTDGSDGVTDDAGALVDGGSVTRGALAGFDAQDSLSRADAGRFLEASGDLVHTGPTGTNVCDLVIGWKRT